MQDEVVVPNPNDFVVPDDAQNVVEEEEPMMSKEEAVVVEEQPSMVRVCPTHDTATTTTPRYRLGSPSSAPPQACAWLRRPRSCPR